MYLNVAMSPSRPSKRWFRACAVSRQAQAQPPQAQELQAQQAQQAQAKAQQVQAQQAQAQQQAGQCLANAWEIALLCTRSQENQRIQMILKERIQDS